MSDHGHDRAAGALCTDDGDGLCATCGVALTECGVCHGIGYHRTGCPDSDDVAPAPLAMSRTNVRGLTYPTALQSFQFFHDSSWGNDDTDSVAFAVGTTAITVWIDHEDRECSVADMMDHRFVVCRLCDPDPDRSFSKRPPTLQEMVNERQISDEPPLLETNDPHELLAFLSELARAEFSACLSSICDGGAHATHRQ